MGSPNTSSPLSLSLLVPFLLIFTSFFPLNCNSQGTKIKGMFVFGDSIVDNGNNFFLKTNGGGAKYLPYGIDFPQGPTGRFTNGKNVIDCFCDHLSLPLLPPFYDPSTTGVKIINGVDFASGGSGILDDTGSVQGNVANLNTQMSNFQNKTLPALEAQLGKKGMDFLGSFLFVVAVGGNDYTTNYFKQPSTQTLEVFTYNLILSLSTHLKNLYNLGCRKFVLMSPPPFGCDPSLTVPQIGCNQTINNGLFFYSSQLKSMADDLQSQLLGSHFVFMNNSKIIMDLIGNPISQGFQDAKDSCCEITPFGGCVRGGKACPDRKQFIFFDGIHPSEAVNDILASKAFSSILPSEVSPINVAQLSNL